MFRKLHVCDSKPKLHNSEHKQEKRKPVNGIVQPRQNNSQIQHVTERKSQEAMNFHYKVEAACRQESYCCESFRFECICSIIKLAVDKTKGKKNLNSLKGQFYVALPKVQEQMVNLVLPTIISIETISNSSSEQRIEKL